MKQTKIFFVFPFVSTYYYALKTICVTLAHISFFRLVRGLLILIPFFISIQKVPLLLILFVGFTTKPGKNLIRKIKFSHLIVFPRFSFHFSHYLIGSKIKTIENTATGNTKWPKKKIQKIVYSRVGIRPVWLDDEIQNEFRFWTKASSLADLATE